jgi:hypothetical protein
VIEKKAIGGEQTVSLSIIHGHPVCVRFRRGGGLHLEIVHHIGNEVSQALPAASETATVETDNFARDGRDETGCSSRAPKKLRAQSTTTSVFVGQTPSVPRHIDASGIRPRQNDPAIFLQTNGETLKIFIGKGGNKQRGLISRFALG